MYLRPKIDLKFLLIKNFQLNKHVTLKSKSILHKVTYLQKIGQ